MCNSHHHHPVLEQFRGTVKVPAVLLPLNPQLPVQAIIHPLFQETEELCNMQYSVSSLFLGSSIPLFVTLYC